MREVDNAFATIVIFKYHRGILAIMAIIYAALVFTSEDRRKVSNAKYPLYAVLV